MLRVLNLNNTQKLFIYQLLYIISRIFNINSTHCTLGGNYSTDNEIRYHPNFNNNVVLIIPYKKHVKICQKFYVECIITEVKVTIFSKRLVLINE